jgi:hypothetical protein
MFVAVSAGKLFNSAKMKPLFKNNAYLMPQLAKQRMWAAVL